MNQSFRGFNKMSRKILVTGAAGFIGCEVSLILLSKGYEVVGIDNLNDYYQVSLKEDRLKRLDNPNFRFEKMDLADATAIKGRFEREHFDGVIHLGAQAGVRYSLVNPQAYIDSNITGFLNILEGCRFNPVEHLTYASSSSVYGRNTKTPFATEDPVCMPSSLYAATKRSNELMAETYHHLYKINATGLRFFTVYGPWGRPDMAPWLFADAILHDRPIKIFNNGNMMRDFTYIDDIAQGVVRVFEAGIGKKECRLYNIGHGNPVNLLDFVKTLEKHLGKTAEKIYMPMQPGDVEVTWADTKALEQDVGYTADTDLDTGIKAFAEWFKGYNR
jgi:UDP-glucuronate 4-epimerase